MDATEPTAKRKRSGKAREEAKARAIAKAEEAARETERAEQAGEDEKGSHAGEDGEGEGEDGEAGKEEEEDPSKRIPDIEVIRKRIVSDPSPPRLSFLILIRARQPQALKSLHPILKRSKASETQRIIKKIKFLRTKAQQGPTTELADLEGQLEALKVSPRRAASNFHSSSSLSRRNSTYILQSHHSSTSNSANTHPFARSFPSPTRSFPNRSHQRPSTQARPRARHKTGFSRPRERGNS